MATFDIKMPKMGESVTECTITVLMVQQGDYIEEDTDLFEITSAKTAATIPSPVAGRIVKINYAEGDTVAVGLPVIVVDTEGEATAPSVEEPKQAESNGAEQVTSPSPSTPVEVHRGSVERWYSPVVLERAKAAKISQEELDSLQGTGFGGRVSKTDIVRYIEQKKGAPAPTPRAERSAVPSPATQRPQVAAPAVPIGPEDRVIPMDPIRRIIADRMVQSVQVAPRACPLERGGEGCLQKEGRLRPDLHDTRRRSCSPSTEGIPSDQCFCRWLQHHRAQARPRGYGGSPARW